MKLRLSSGDLDQHLCICTLSERNEIRWRPPYYAHRPPLYPLMTLPASQAMLGPCAGGWWRAGVAPVPACVLSSSVSVVAAALSSGGGRAAPRNPLLAGSPLSARSRFEPDPKKGKSGVDRFRRRRSDPTRTPPSFRRWGVPPARDLSARPPRWGVGVWPPSV